ncbi:hypothetical protein AYI68_g6629 [Smittium mucronatum]|uniref:Uncharacterized protein n=1 Tax=Smittium mucronatum TaxID=133383 RepID=A0A1R0GQY6_9FUNG|nr:hypothetical protein AYI68_g6629 [Smittium mucronatum]
MGKSNQISGCEISNFSRYLPGISTIPTFLDPSPVTSIEFRKIAFIPLSMHTNSPINIRPSLELIRTVVSSRFRSCSSPLPFSSSPLEYPIPVCIDSIPYTHTQHVPI